MKHILNKLEKMENAAFQSLRIGLFTVMLCCIILLVYINNASSFKEFTMFKNAIPSLVMSAFIVFGGGFAFDAVLKEKK